MLCQTRVSTPRHKPGEVSDEDEARMANLPDVPVADGGDVYMRMVRFDGNLNIQPQCKRHLFTISGFTDDSWFYRTLWMLDDDRRLLGYTSSFTSPRSHFFVKHVDPETSKGDHENFAVPAGQLTVFDQEDAYGIRTIDDQPGSRGATAGCRIHARKGNDTKWIYRVPVQFQSMVLAGGTLFVAGWPDADDPQDPLGGYEDRKGGLLWAVSPADGKKLAEYKLELPPVFDGLIAAGGRLYLSTRDGRVLCLGGQP